MREGRHLEGRRCHSPTYAPTDRKMCFLHICTKIFGFLCENTHLLVEMYKTQFSALSRVAPNSHENNGNKFHHVFSIGYPSHDE
jgi:hypothetical protein